jgi:hypothetical protein
MTSLKNDSIDLDTIRARVAKLRLRRRRGVQAAVIALMLPVIGLSVRAAGSRSPSRIVSATSEPDSSATVGTSSPAVTAQTTIVLLDCESYVRESVHQLIDEQRTSKQQPSSCFQVPSPVLAGSDNTSCWSTCQDGAEIVTIARSADVVDVVDPSGRAGWASSAIVTRRRGSRSVEFRETVEIYPGNGELSTVWTATDTIAEVSAGKEAFGEYIRALSVGDYLAAAGILGGGGQDLSERKDLEQLTLENFGVQALASGLESWCERALCNDPTAVEVRPLPDGGVEVIAEFGAVSGRFTVGMYEGTPAIYGVPPLAHG